jgi:hypothetical protein
MERRSGIRQKAFMKGRIYFDNKRRSADCLIRDVSELGARLRFSSVMTTPDLFELHILARGESRRARVQWRNGEEIGVSFVSDEIAPSLVPSAAPADLPARVYKLEQEVASMQRKFNELQTALRTLIPAAE